MAYLAHITSSDHSLHHHLYIKFSFRVCSSTSPCYLERASTFIYYWLYFLMMVCGNKSSFELNSTIRSFPPPNHFRLIIRTNILYFWHLTLTFELATYPPREQQAVESYEVTLKLSQLLVVLYRLEIVSDNTCKFIDLWKGSCEEKVISEK